LRAHAFRSSLHTVVEEEAGEGRHFRLQPGERLDRDFILRFQVAAERVGTSLFLQPDADEMEGTFLLTLVPPAEAREAPRPRDVVFVLDRSGSMGGWKMVAARRAVARMAETLTERDRFNVYAFDDCIEAPPGLGGLGLVAATHSARCRAAEFLEKVEARGGTEMAQPLTQAVTVLTEGLNRSARVAGAERVLVLITDGQVGNEDQILRQLGPRLKGVRVFTLGIDQAVNAAFLRRLADLGGGASEVVESEERLDEVMGQVHRHIGTPVLTGLRLEPAGLALRPESVVSGRLPDLFAGAPLLIAGRYQGRSSGGVAVRGLSAAGQAWSAEVSGCPVEGAPLASMWARGRVRELEDRYVSGAPSTGLEQEIVATSLRFGVLCRFTAFVAVDRDAVVNPGGQVHEIVQPVEQPAGWRALDAGQFCVAGRMSHVRAERHAPAPNWGTPSCMAPEQAGGAEQTRTADPNFGAELELTDAADTFAFMGPVPPGDLPGAAGGNTVTDYDQAAGGNTVTDYDQPERSRRKPRAKAARADRAAKIGAGGGGPGLLSRLLGLFRRKSKGAVPVIDRAAYRPRAEALLLRLQADAPPPLDRLRGVVDELEVLFRDLTMAGDRDASVEELGQVVVRARALLAQAQPGEADAEALCQRAVSGLTSWLGLTPPAAREEFWK
jgi:Ca-activated chloride channel family protein